MGLTEELQAEAKSIFRNSWTSRDGQVVPVPTDLQLGNDAVKLDATVLYADMDGSTALVDSKTAEMAAEIYKAYLVCAAKVIKAEGGAITAYDGDRIMAVFVGSGKNSLAARTGLKLNWALKHIVNQQFAEMYTSDSYRLRHKVGIDTSKLHVCRVGVRGDNDLAWIGNAANYAAKLSAVPDDFSGVYLTARVFNNMADSSKFGGSPTKLMWEKRTWTNTDVYRSDWTWSL